MAAVVQQVNDLADLQNRSQALIDLAVQNAAIRGNIARKVMGMQEQVRALAGVLAAARGVADKVEGATERQTAHLDKLAAALNQAPTSAELETSVDELGTLVGDLCGPPGSPTASMEPVSAINNPVSAPPTADELPFQDARSRGGYRYSRRRKTPTRKRKTPTRKRRKSKTRRR